MFWVNRITDPTWPARILASRPGPAEVPSSPTMIRWPSSFASEAGSFTWELAGADGGAGDAAPVGCECGVARIETAATHAVGNAAAVAGIATDAATDASKLRRTQDIRRG